MFAKIYVLNGPRVLLKFTRPRVLGGGFPNPPRKIVLLIVRIIQNFQRIFVGVNEAAIQKIGQFHCVVDEIYEKEDFAPCALIYISTVWQILE